MNKIRPFREEPNLLNKIGVSLLYIVLAWIVARQPIATMGNLLSIFMILGILVWVFVIRHRNIKYFIRYHVVQALLLNLSLAALIWLLVALLQLLNTLPGLNMIAGVIGTALFASMSVGGYFEASAFEILVFSLGAVLAIYCVMGKYTELPWITDGVRHWI